MSFGLDTRNIEFITSHAEAKAYFEATKPWRNTVGDKRPLDKNRRKHHCAIQKLRGPEDTTDYACILYDTPLVTFYADGTVMLFFHPSRSSLAFMWAVLGISIINAEPLGYAVELGDKIYLVTGDSLLIQRNAAGAWEPVDLTQTTPWFEKYVDRKVVAAISKSLGVERFATWYKAAQALQTEPPILKDHNTDYLALVAQDPRDWYERNLHRDPYALSYIISRIRARAVAVKHAHTHLTSWRDVHRLRRQASRVNRYEYSAIRY